MFLFERFLLDFAMAIYRRATALKSREREALGRKQTRMER